MFLKLTLILVFTTFGQLFSDPEFKISKPFNQVEASGTIIAQPKDDLEFEKPVEIARGIGNNESIIYEIESWKQIPIDKIDKNCIFVTDLDDTLIRYGDCLQRHLSELSRHYTDAKTVIKVMLKLYPKVSWAKVSAKIFSDRNSDLIEPCTKGIFETLSQKGIPTIVCTACVSDPAFIEERATKLDILGIKLFLPSYFIELRANSALSKWYGTPWYKKPVFYRKMLVTDHLHEKGPMIMALLKAICPIKHYPTKIILVDDLLTNLEQMSEECSKYGLDFVGYHYQNHAKDIPWNLDMVMFQLKILFEKGFWLRDESAKKLYAKAASVTLK